MSKISKKGMEFLRDLKARWPLLVEDVGRLKSMLENIPGANRTPRTLTLPAGTASIAVLPIPEERVYGVTMTGVRTDGGKYKCKLHIGYADKTRTGNLSKEYFGPLSKNEHTLVNPLEVSLATHDLWDADHPMIGSGQIIGIEDDGTYILRLMAGGGGGVEQTVVLDVFWDEATGVLKKTTVTARLVMTDDPVTSDVEAAAECVVPP